MKKPGWRFAGGVELSVGTHVIRLIVRELDANTFNWLADVRIRSPLAPLTGALGESNAESSADTAQKAVCAAASFFAGCGVHLTAELRTELDRALVGRTAADFAQPPA